MRTSNDTDAKMLHEIMQPLNVIQMACGNIRATVARGSNDDAQYIINKVARIEEQIARATQLLVELQNRYDDPARTS